jgi:membrane fusion protein (multidrug efflux system)
VINRFFPLIICLATLLLSASCAKHDGPAVAKSGAEGKAGAAAKGANAQKQPVEVTPIRRRDLVETLPVVGSLAANEMATVRPEMPGLISSINFEEGQRVKKGDLLVKINDAELQAQYAQSQARFDLAKLNLARAESLRQTQSNTQADVDRARSEYAAAEADVALLRVRLARTEVRAPFDGTAESRTLSPGDYVNTQSIITTISDLSRIKVEFQIPERYLAKVRRGTLFTVRSSSVEATSAQGEVYFVNSVIDRNTRSSEVKGYLSNPPPTLRPGMFTIIEIVLDVRKDALTVPEGAILVDQRGPQVVTVNESNGDKVAGVVPVTLGLRSKGYVEVQPLKGQFADDQLVVAAGVGSLALFPGAKLEARPLHPEVSVPKL